MKRKKMYILFVPVLIFSFGTSSSQTCGNLNFQHQADIPSVCNSLFMTMIHDRNDLPYLYVANKGAGLTVYDLSEITFPSLVATVPTTLFDTLDVMSLSQYGNYLYLALGNSFTNPQKGGIAVIDISTPTAPVVTDYYVVPGSGSGGGIVRVEGNYAYLGAMQSGLVILDVTDKNNVQFVSQFVPDINFPPVASPNPSLYNARGMEVSNSIVYLCYDGGGIRIINCTDKIHPIETGHWCNPVMYSPTDHPKAYNNCILDDTLLYVAVDYCGMEVLNVRDTGNITLTGWWNPYNCPNNNWFTSPSYANEMQYDKYCKRIFMSTGRSDMMVIDVSDPTLPDSCNYYGGVDNGIGTWGIGMWHNQIYLSYICSIIPFPSSLTQLTILTFDPCTAGKIDEHSYDTFTVFPNPFSGQTTLHTNNYLRNATLILTNLLGETMWQMNFSGQTLIIRRNKLPAGIYFMQLSQGTTVIATKKLVIKD